MALDWIVRIWTPRWAALVPVFRDLAVALCGLPPIVDLATAEAAGSLVAVLSETPAQAERAIAPYRDNCYDNAAATAARHAAGLVCVQSAGPLWPAPRRPPSTTRAQRRGPMWLAPTAESLRQSAVDLCHRLAAVRQDAAAGPV